MEPLLFRNDMKQKKEIWWHLVGIAIESTLLYQMGFHVGIIEIMLRVIILIVIHSAIYNHQD